MSTSFLTAASGNAAALARTIPQDDLAVYFFLSDTIHAKSTASANPSTFGVCPPIVALRYLGFVPTDFMATPEVV